MTVSVKIPTQLRSLTGGSAEVEADGGTIGEIIDDLEASHPGVKERLIDPDGGLRRFVNVYLDDEDVRFLNGVSTPVPDGATLSIIPAVAGGAPRTRLLRAEGNRAPRPGRVLPSIDPRRVHWP